MYIIIVGGGKVGYFLSLALLGEGHEILIIEHDANKCKAIAEDLGSVVMRGDGCEAKTLEDAGARRADLLVAVTHRDEVNLVACQVSKHKFGVPRTIARISNPKNEALFKMLGINVTVSSTNLILEHIEESLPTRSLVHLLSLEEGNLEIVEMNVMPDYPAVGKRVGEITLPENSLICLVINEAKGARVPAAESVIEAGDHIIAVTQPDREDELRAALTG
ncbi:MAG: TrkA family potassium uptake protein [Chloroflexota bacterium]|nr:TrkA family potassium uptake protein [Chloroflexota bacterium]